MSNLPSGYNEPESIDDIITRKDTEIAELNLEVSRLKIKSLMALELSRKRYNEGLRAGQESMVRTNAEYAKSKNEWLDENEKLTNMVLSLEDEVARLDRLTVEMKKNNKVK